MRAGRLSTHVLPARGAPTRLLALNPLLLVGGALLAFFLPGYLLLQALFPRQRWFGPFHPFALPALSLVLSSAIVVLLGAALGFAPGGRGGLGWLQGNRTGAPILEVALLSLVLVLFVVAWRRGAFPRLGRAAPVRSAAAERGEPEDVTLLRDLRLEENRLRREARRVRKRARESRDPGVRNALAEAADELDRSRRDVAHRARELERQAARRIYGAGVAYRRP